MLAWRVGELLEAESERVAAWVGCHGGVDGKPVGEVGHVERGDAQNVEQALRAPVFEQGLELEVGGRRVQAHDGVRDVDLVLLG